MSFVSDFVMAYNIATGRESLFEGGGEGGEGADHAAEGKAE